uniref:Uncharacterized protein n=1 Tax=Brassica oleracea TaxID=3712 RepID=A0A3P6AZ59_BRAOL|nr:unnamed protein product [Brassica oleracea]
MLYISLICFLLFGLEAYLILYRCCSRKKEKKAYRDLVESGDVESDEDEEEEEENDLDMVVQFNTRLEDLKEREGFREESSS